MIIAFIIIITLCIGYFSPYIIKHAERAVIDSAKDIAPSVTGSSGVLLSLAVIAVPTCLFIYLTANTAIAINVFLMGVCVYFDIKRRWIPDPALFTLMFAATYYFSNTYSDFNDLASTVIAMTLPYVMLNMYAFCVCKRNVFVASGDIYFAIPVALLSGDWSSGLLISASSLFLALITMFITRLNQLPLLPFIYLPALIVIATKNPA